MKKFLICTILCEIFLVKVGFADNQQYFDNAYQTGKQNQFNFNLNQNSNFTTYSQANKIESNIYNGASEGEQGSHDMYDNASKNDNYLSTKGKQDIANCKSKTDPRCSTLNKYGDKDTQTKLQAYMQGFKQEYYIDIKPDPADSSCSIVTRRVQENQISYCVTSAKIQYGCNSTININLNYYQCNPTNGGCNAYINNPRCQNTVPYIAPSCLAYSFTYSYGCTNWGGSSCSVGSTYRYPGNCGTNGGTAICDGTIKSGKVFPKGGGPYNCNGVGCAGKDWSCSNYNQGQLAQYACRISNYSDGCSGYK
jgi:hypothetical protein